MKNPRKRLGMVSMAAVFGGAVTVGSLVFNSIDLTLGVAAGAALMTLDVFLLRRVVAGVLGSESPDASEVKRKRRWLLFQYILKTVGLLVVLAALIWKTNVSPGGILVGVTAAIIGPMYVGLRDAEVENE